MSATRSACCRSVRWIAGESEGEGRSWGFLRRCDVISIAGAVNVIVYLIVAGLIFGLLWWLVNYIALPDPFGKFARIALAILAVMVIIGILLSVVGGTPVF